MSSQRIDLKHSTPLNPTENGLAERAMPGLMKALRCAKIEKFASKKALEMYVACYNSWPHHTTGKAPADVMFGRILRGMLPVLGEDLQHSWDEDICERDHIKKMLGKEYIDKRRNAKWSGIEIGALVLIESSEATRVKMDSFYGEDTWKVMAKQGGRLELENTKTGKKFSRATKHVKFWHREGKEIVVEPEIIPKGVSNLPMHDDDEVPMDSMMSKEQEAEAETQRNRVTFYFNFCYFILFCFL